MNQDLYNRHYREALNKGFTREKARKYAEVHTYTEEFINTPRNELLRFDRMDAESVAQELAQTIINKIGNNKGKYPETIELMLMNWYYAHYEEFPWIEREKIQEVCRRAGQIATEYMEDHWEY
jgi:hypothetical protein